MKIWIRTCTYYNTHMCTCARTHTHTHSYCSQIDTRIHMDVWFLCVYTNDKTHARARAHTHTNTYLYTSTFSVHTHIFLHVRVYGIHQTGLRHSTFLIENKDINKNKNSHLCSNRAPTFEPSSLSLSLSCAILLLFYYPNITRIENPMCTCTPCHPLDLAFSMNEILFRFKK